MDSNDFRLSTRLQLSPEVTETVYSGIAEIDAIKHTFRLTDRLLPHTLERLTQTVMTSTGASNRIEGNRLADDELNSVVSILKANRYIAPVLTFEEMVLSKRPAQDSDSHACLIGEFYMDWASGQIKDIPIADLETKIRKGGEGAAASNGTANVPTSNGTLAMLVCRLRTVIESGSYRGNRFRTMPLALGSGDHRRSGTARGMIPPI
jgi:hypothetical protein